jgi:hypothetical protein
MKRRFMNGTLGRIEFGRINQGKSDGQDKWKVQGKGEKYTGYFVQIPEENDHLGDLRVQDRIILNCILKKEYGRTLKVLICITTESKWLALVEMVINIRVPLKKRVIS